MPIISLTVDPSMTTGGLMKPEHLTVPLAELEGYFQGGADYTSFLMENAPPHDQSLYGRNFRSRAVSDVFRNREDEPWSYGWDDADPWDIGNGQVCVVPGCSIRFFARDPIRSVMVSASFEYSLGDDFDSECRCEVLWDEDEGGLRHNTALIRPKIGYSFDTHALHPMTYSSTFAQNLRFDKWDRVAKPGWHSVTTRVSTGGSTGGVSSLIRISRAIVSVVAVYR